MDAHGGHTFLEDEGHPHVETLLNIGSGTDPNKASKELKGILRGPEEEPTFITQVQKSYQSPEAIDESNTYVL